MSHFDDDLGASQIDVHSLLKLDREPTLADFVGAVNKIIEAYGLSNAIYFCPSFKGRSFLDPFAVFTYGQEWADHYVRSNYGSIDPVVSTGARSLLPVDWARLDRSSPKVARLFNESREAGVGAQGLTIPIRGPENGTWALLSFTSNESDKEWRRRRAAIVPELVMTGYFLHQKAFELHNSGEQIDLNAITRREKEALAWTAEGKSVADIAVLMRISGETVKAHLDSARFKLGALNRVHAVTKAIRHGIIS